MNWPYFLAGIATCILLQWLWAAWNIGDFVLRVMRRGRLADTIGALLVWAIVFVAGWVALAALWEYLQLTAWSIRAGRY